MSDYNSAKTRIDSEEGFAKDPGTEVVISNNDSNSTDLVSAYDLNTDAETRVAPVEVVNEGIDPNDAFPGIHKGIKTGGTPETIEEGDEVETARAAARDEDRVDDGAKTSEVPEGSIKDVLAWVDGDADKAKLALEAEEKGEKRTTLIKQLSEIK